MNLAEIGSEQLRRLLSRNQESTDQFSQRSLGSSLVDSIHTYANNKSEVYNGNIGDVQELVYSNIEAFLPFSFTQNVGFDYLDWDISITSGNSSILMLGYDQFNKGLALSNALGTVFIHKQKNVETNEMEAAHISITGVLADSRGKNRVVAPIYDGNTKVLKALNVSVKNTELPVVKYPNYTYAEYNQITAPISLCDDFQYGRTGFITNAMVEQTNYQQPRHTKMLRALYQGSNDLVFPGEALAQERRFYSEYGALPLVNWPDVQEFGRRGGNRKSSIYSDDPQAWFITVPQRLYQV